MARFCIGFTLIEILVVLLIIGILVSVALPQYQKAVERSRMGEALVVLEEIAKAQQSVHWELNAFSDNFSLLDIELRDATGNVYYTKGNSGTGASGDGFAIELHPGSSYDTGYALAIRYKNPGSSTYEYSLKRLYADTSVTCSSDQARGQALCADFCGISTPVQSCCSDGTSQACPEQARMRAE